MVTQTDVPKNDGASDAVAGSGPIVGETVMTLTLLWMAITLFCDN